MVYLVLLGVTGVTNIAFRPGGRKWSEKLNPKLKGVPGGVPRGPRWSQVVPNES